MEQSQVLSLFDDLPQVQPAPKQRKQREFKTPDRDAYQGVAQSFSTVQMFGWESAGTSSDDDMSLARADPAYLAYVRAESEWIKEQPWFDQFAIALHCRALDDALEQLTSNDVKPDAMKLKGETLQWVFAQKVINGRPAMQIPFSFELCAHYFGIDPDVFRAGLLQVPLIRSLIVQLNLDIPDGLPPLRPVPRYREIVTQLYSRPERYVYQFPGS